MRFKYITIAIIMMCSTSVYAAEIDQYALSEAGFSDVSKLLQDMTPEQRDAVMKQAIAKAKELRKMTPEQLATLRTQLLEVGDTIMMDKVDPAKLDPEKSKPAPQTKKNMDSYQTKHTKKQVHNSVVKPTAADQ